MLRYKLRTLQILAGVGPPLLAAAWFLALSWGTSPVKAVGGTLLLLCLMLAMAALITDNG